MKKIFALAAVCCGLLMSGSAGAQGDKKPASPPAKVSQTIENGATVTISYSQPSLKGRTIGVDVEPKKNTVWRMGANNATVFEVDRDVKIEGKELPKGRYSMFGKWTDDGYTLIFNSAADIWGTRYEQNKDKDVLQVEVKSKTSESTQELLTYTIDKSGKVNLLWGNLVIGFKVE